MLCVTSDGACGGSMSHIYVGQSEPVQLSLTGGDAAAMRTWYSRACLHGMPAEPGCSAGQARQGVTWAAVS